MISFYLKGDIEKTSKFLSSLHIFTLAESLGGVESLIESPALMTHGSVPPAHRKMLGIDDNFVRVSCGIENVEDLINDLNQALDKI
jgi:cystathionine gamma-lyase